MPGTLFVVATPIGNLEDISMRALRVLREVDLVAAEDTRRTAKLLAHYEIRVPMVSLHEHNERREAPRLLARLTAGESIALVSDAGTPTISDPGRDLVKAARQQGLPVVPIPGPSAVTTALAGSGFPADRFLFMGFPPRSGSAREEWLEALAAEPGAVVCFEAPTRIHETLKDIAGVVVKRPILTCRELTKLHEILVEYTTAADIPARGEFTVVVAPLAEGSVRSGQITPEAVLVSQLVEQLSEGAHVGQEAAEAMVARAFKVKPSQIKNIIKKHVISVKQQKQQGGRTGPS
jgi:16S rRNA (cytidine1402-2'-O)-methyltransferase